MISKINFGRLFACLAMAVCLTTSCDDYLDEMPDNRTELDTEKKIVQLLVSAYPDRHYALLAEMFSDNTDQVDGSGYSAYIKLQEQAAKWEDITEKNDDSPYDLWNACYSATASANAALEAIAEAGDPASLQAAKGEALLCRAFNHFLLANIFCLAYNPETADQDMGLPYMKHVESTVSPHYERGTMAELYANIEQDILEGLPLIDDNLYSVPKYHFNQKAAQAFAARFYLYYTHKDKSNLDRVIKYATDVLTDDATTMLRDWAYVGALSPNNNIRPNAFIDVNERANLLLLSTYSLWCRVFGPYGLGYKYCHGSKIASNETCSTSGLWGAYTALRFRVPQYSGMPKVIMAKYAEQFEYTDPVNGIGYAHVMYPVLTTDETLIDRAEAYALKGDFTRAAADLNDFVHAFSTRTTAITTSVVTSRYGSSMAYYTPTKPTPKKRLNPLGFTVEEGTQEAFIHAILHTRRVLNLHDGIRWFDVKRYGIKIYRRTIKQNGDIEVTDSMEVDDPRRALQLPQAVINADLTPNPRRGAEEIED